MQSLLAESLAWLPHGVSHIERRIVPVVLEDLHGVVLLRLQPRELVLLLLRNLFSPGLEVARRPVLGGVVSVLGVGLERNFSGAERTFDVEAENFDAEVVFALDCLLPRVELLPFIDIFTTGVATPADSAFRITINRRGKK